MPEMEDLAFVLALARGDASAMHTFEVRHRPLVGHAFGVAQRRWRPESPVQSEDYVQDFVGALFIDHGKRLKSYAGRSAFGSWLYVVSLRYFQRRLSQLVGDRRGDEVLDGLPDLGAHGAEQSLLRAEQAERVRAAVSSLPAEDKLYVRLLFVEDLNANEVARTLGKGASAVRMKKMRLLDRLRVLLGEEEEGESAESAALLAAGVHGDQAKKGDRR